MHTQDPVRIKILMNPSVSKLVLARELAAKTEFPSFVRHPFFLQVLFRLAYPGNFRVCIDDGGDGVVVDVSVSGFDEVDSSDT